LVSFFYLSKKNVHNIRSWHHFRTFDLWMPSLLPKFGILIRCRACSRSTCWNAHFVVFWSRAIFFSFSCFSIVTKWQFLMHVCSTRVWYFLMWKHINYSESLLFGCRYDWFLTKVYQIVQIVTHQYSTCTPSPH